MEIIIGVYALFVTWFAVDTKLELEELKDQPPKIVKVIQIQEVEIPIAADCPKPKLINEPELVINKIDSDSDYGFIANAYVVSLNQCMSYGEQQRAVLDSYR